MSTTPAATRTPAPARIAPALAFYLQASITVVFMAGSSAPTPLYALYQARWGFTSTMVTVIFAVYAIAVLAAVLVAGRLSDHVGRRPVLLAAIAVQLVAMAMFATASSVGHLVAARIVQGLSAGAGIAAVAGGLLDLHKARGTIANAVSTPIGTALGAILAGMMVRFLPAPTHLVFGVLAGLLVLQGIGVMMMAETSFPRPGAWGSLRPRLSLSPSVREPMLLAIPALVAVWALAGFYASLGPSLVRGLLGIDSALVGGLSLFVLAASAAVVTVAMRDAAPRTLTVFGAAVLLAGLAVALAALSLRSPTLFFLGTSLAGMAFGAGFPGAIRTISQRAAAHERAGVLSVALTVSYLAMGLPAVVAGYLATRQGDIVLTAREYAVVLMGLALLTLAGALRRSAAR
jgi:predicted MFS family arabinose efflux permease